MPRLFVSEGGQRGPQVDILTPGTYRILSQSVPVEGGQDVKPGLFSIRLFDATVINENQIGLVEALDGSPLNPGDYVAESVAGHDNSRMDTSSLTARASAAHRRTSCCPALTTSIRCSSK